MQEKYIKAYELFIELCEKNEDFKLMVYDNMEKKLVRFFSDEEWNKIENQNFIPPEGVTEFKEFSEMFELGYNIGNCIGTSRQLSYSYRDVDLVSGILPILKGTRNAELEGGHGWLETREYIIDTSLMLVIHKSVKSDFGYIEEERVTYSRLLKNAMYQQRKEFVNDRYLRGSKKGL